MRLAVLGDIHSNSVALATFNREIEKDGVDGVIFTGDLVTDCAYPERTVALVREIAAKYPTYMVRGNRESYLLRHRNNPDEYWPYDSHSGSVRYTYESLSAEELDFLFSLPETREIQIPGCDPFFLCHGSPTLGYEPMRPGEDNTKEYLDSSTCPLMICGHTHQQFVYEYGGTALLNPGSLGIPIHGNPDAQYALLEWSGHRWEATLKEISYDYQKTIDEIQESGLMEKGLYWPKCVRKQLQTGHNYIMDCIRLALKLAESDGLTFDNQHIPIQYWEAAAKQLDIR